MADKKTEKAEEVILTPSEYFNLLKGKREKMDQEELASMYDKAVSRMKKYMITGQKEAAVRLYNFAKCCENELSVLEAGIDTYVDRKDLEEYIDKIAHKTVCLIELENYVRDIPDDVLDVLIPLKEKKLFDNYYVLFTDYTGKERKKVETKRRDKDPILFGTLKIGNQINTRLYYIASWEDEYCDLTLDKLVKEFTEVKGESPAKSVKSLYKTENDFIKAFDDYQKENYEKK